MNVVSLEDRACGTKRKMGAARARDVAQALTDRTGERISPYRCPWCQAWHVGHTPSMATVTDLAKHIRERSYPSAS